MAFRSPTSDESRLLRALATIANIANPDSWLETLRVQDMDDGGMGSLELVAPTSHRPGRRETVCRAAVQFPDEDGIEVIASLYTDEHGVPFELDMWKANFTKLVRIPHQFRRVDE